MKAVLGSEESLKNDYFNQVHFDWESARDLGPPIQFIHGIEDSIHSPADMAKLASLAGCPNVKEWAGVGHLLQYEELDKLIIDATRTFDAMDVKK